MDLDADHRRVGEPYVFATTSGSFHDMLVVDACGDLIVTAYYGRGVSRITPGGEVTLLAELPEEHHHHGGAWGSGVGPWGDHVLYLAQPNLGNVVSTWAYGRPGRAWRSGGYVACGGSTGGVCER